MKKQILLPILNCFFIVQDMVRGVNDDIQYNKREVQMLRQEKEQLENVLTHKSTEVRKNL